MTSLLPLRKICVPPCVFPIQGLLQKRPIFRGPWCARPEIRYRSARNRVCLSYCGISRVLPSDRFATICRGPQKKLRVVFSLFFIFFLLSFSVSSRGGGVKWRVLYYWRSAFFGSLALALVVFFIWWNFWTGAFLVRFFFGLEMSFSGEQCRVYSWCCSLQWKIMVSNESIEYRSRLRDIFLIWGIMQDTCELVTHFRFKYSFYKCMRALCFIYY